jgi:hypothetical protein
MPESKKPGKFFKDMLYEKHDRYKGQMPA